MSLRFIYGRSGSGKTHLCFEEIKARVDDNADVPLILLVPENLSFQAEKDLLKHVGERGILKAQVLSFKRMAYKVFSEIGGLTRSHMNMAGRCMLLYSIMDKINKNLKIFQKSVRLQGFVDKVSDMIAELKSYGITPDILKSAGEKVEGSDILKYKIDDISLIFSEFEEKLHENYIDSEDDLVILGEKLEDYKGFDGGEVWIDGFSMMSPQQINIVEKLLKKTRRVNVTLCTDYISGGNFIEFGDMFKSVKSMENKLRDAAHKQGIEIESPLKVGREPLPRFEESPELAHLEKNFFAFRCRRYEAPTKDISLFRALNKYTEVQWAARDIVSMCRDRNMRYSQIAVVTRDVSGYERLVSSIFPEYNIPFFMDKKRDIDSNPLIVLIMSAIEIYLKNWNYETVFRYLKTGLTDIDREDIDVLENYVLAAGIRGRKWTDDSDWTFWPEEGPGAEEISEEAKCELERINEIRRRVSSPLIGFFQRVKGVHKVREIAQALFEFLTGLSIYERIEYLVEKFKMDGQLAQAKEYSKVWNILIETLDQAVEVMGNEDMTLEQFSKIISIGFREYKIGLIPPAVDQVMFGDVEILKGHSIKALYILGVNDGVFPMPAGAEGILSDRDRESLKGLGLELAPDSKDKVFEEQFIVYSTFAASQKYIKVSYPMGDQEGRAMRPSIIISRLKRIFPNLTESSNVIVKDTDEENLNLVSAPLPTFNELVSALRKREDGSAISPIWNGALKWYKENPGWKVRLKRALGALNYTNQVESVSPEKVKQLYGREMYFSVSRLEKYARCPFSYFMEYGLKAKERKVFELSPPDIGSFIHMVLDKFSTYMDENNITWRDLEKDQCEKIIGVMVDEAADKAAILSSSPRYAYFKERLKKIILRSIWLIAIHIKKGGFDPKGHEIVFGGKGEYPPIRIELPSGERLNLIGRIDRVDTMEDEDTVYVRIVDYKSGSKDFSLSDVYNGLELQLLIYLDAILERSWQRNGKRVIPGGILYFKVDDPIIKAGGEMSQEEVEREIMKELRMKGLLLSDVKVIREMDREMDGYSLIIPASIKSDGSLGASSSAAGEEDFEALRRHVKNTIIKLCEDMLKGNITISPYRKKRETPCKYCSYKAVCRFDISIKENSYRVIKDRSKDEVWDAIRQVSRGKEGIR